MIVLASSGYIKYTISELFSFVNIFLLSYLIYVIAARSIAVAFCIRIIAIVLFIPVVSSSIDLVLTL